jgi:hypothetical protein
MAHPLYIHTYIDVSMHSFVKSIRFSIDPYGKHSCRLAKRAVNFLMAIRERFVAACRCGGEAVNTQ